MKYLHLGQDTVVPEESIVGIFDSDNTTQSRVTRDFLNRAQKQMRVVDVSGELFRSFVLCCEENGEMTVYLSQLSSSTLLKRSESDLVIDEG